MTYPEQTPQEPTIVPGYFSAPAPPPSDTPPQQPAAPTAAPHYQAPVYQGQHMPTPVQPYAAPPMYYGATDPGSQPLRDASFLQSIGRFYGKYATFSGRASKSEFWWVAAAMLGLFFIGAILNGMTGADWLAGAYVMFMLTSLIPSLALTMRRLHDANFSGGLAFLWLVPYVGFLIVGILTLMPGRPEGSRFDKQVPGMPANDQRNR